MKTNDIIFCVCLLLALIIGLLIGDFIGKERGIKIGQIDAINGKIYYQLVDKKVWEHK